MASEIKNLKKAAQRIRKAIEKKEKILLFSDSDLDGVTSLIILEEAIKSLGGKIQAICFSERSLEEMYGLNKEAVDFFKKYSPALLITLDCGITNFKEIKLAEKIGLETIIVDHHQILDKIPEASIVVDPKQKGDNYPFKELAAVGISYHLTQLLLGNKKTEALKKSFIELTALGTLADMMKESEDNEIFINEGIPSLRETSRPGLRALLEVVAEPEDSPKQIARKIISLLNITEIKNHLPKSYLLLVSSDKSKAEKISEELYEKTQERRLKVRETTQEIEEKLDSEWLPSIIFEGEEDWPLILTGALASRICNRFKKPTFIFKKGEQLSKGSVRTPKGIDSVKAMKRCTHLLEVFGGHSQASGFTVKNENLDKFKQCLIGYFDNLKL
jgi:single-stranded-DNA-specific exonuclease